MVCNIGLSLLERSCPVANDETTNKHSEMSNGNDVCLKENNPLIQFLWHNIPWQKHILYTHKCAHYDTHSEEAMSHRWHVHSNYRQKLKEASKVMLLRTHGLPWKRQLLNEFAGEKKKKGGSARDTVQIVASTTQTPSSPSPELPGESRGCNSRHAELLLLKLAATCTIHTHTSLCLVDIFI